MKIVVLVKQVPDTGEERKLDLATGRVDRSGGENVVDEINERALEVALRYKDANKGAEVVLLSMGPESATKALRKALSMGADSAIHLVDDSLSGSDALATSAALASALRDAAADLVVAGNESTDGRGGVVPAMVAERLGLPLLGSLDSVEIAAGSVSGQCSAEGGTMTVRAALPAVISVTERAAEARFPNFKGILTAKRKPLAALAADQLELGVAGGSSAVLSTIERPARTAGKKIYDEGNAGVELAEFLVAGRLV